MAFHDQTISVSQWKSKYTWFKKHYLLNSSKIKMHNLYKLSLSQYDNHNLWENVNSRKQTWAAKWTFIIFFLQKYAQEINKGNSSKSLFWSLKVVERNQSGLQAKTEDKQKIRKEFLTVFAYFF